MEMDLMSFTGAVLFGYLLGSVPFGLIFCYLFGLGDIRKIGSGNIGVTNVLRTGHKFVALLTLIFDISKAGLASAVALYLTHNEIFGLLAGFAAIIGHNFPVWLKFKGGKGVAATLGVILVNTPVVGVCTCLTWLLTAVISRYSSLAALVALLMAPVYQYFSDRDLSIIVVFYILFAGLIYVRHIQNIKRLLHHQESKISFKKKGK